MALPKWTGTVLHALGGAALTTAAVIVGIPGYVPLFVTALGGWLREVFQHDLRLTVHQWVEALAWPVGSLVAWAVVEFLL